MARGSPTPSVSSQRSIQSAQKVAKAKARHRKEYEEQKVQLNALFQQIKEAQVHMKTSSQELRTSWADLAEELNSDSSTPPDRVSGCFFVTTWFSLTGNGGRKGLKTG
ncbi:hypothetical protein Nepgr_027380 [Nepenthes gracilis]|uniref:Uncharacterized protein n=1 Tax=Nepenthes gracilis TaxID=150966 RepID=A0AAD3T9Y7_NEPGR|nr:hypothetical protein Nepgr_027380 [Nepenthes gracilis]